MCAFGDTLDWEAETLMFRYSDLHLSTTQMGIVRNVCYNSVIRIATGETVAVYLSKSCCVPPRSRMILVGETNKPPPLTTAAVIGPHFVTGEDFQSSDMPHTFKRLITFNGLVIGE